MDEEDHPVCGLVCIVAASITAAFAIFAIVLLVLWCRYRPLSASRKGEVFCNHSS